MSVDDNMINAQGGVIIIIIFLFFSPRDETSPELTVLAQKLFSRLSIKS